MPSRIIGSFVSPYVRKVLACMNLKGLAYEVDPITPFFGNDEFERLSPLRRIPVLIDGDFTRQQFVGDLRLSRRGLSRHPLLPADPKDRARARWFEEYADTRLGDLFIWGLFYQKIVHPLVWGEPGDQARIEKSLDEDIPAALDYLEGELPADGFLFGDIGVADIADRELLPKRRLCRASRSTPDAGRAPPPSSSARSRTPASPTCCRSRTYSAAPKSRAGARRCSTPARR